MSKSVTSIDEVFLFLIKVRSFLCGPSGGDSDVMRDDELENIRKSMKNKKNTKPKKKRSSAGGGGSTKSKNNKPPVPPSKKDTGKGLSIVSDSGVSTEPDTGAACDSVVHYGTEPSGTSIPAAKRGLEEKNEAAFFKCGVERKSVKEVGTGVADSDDEIPLPEEVPGFERLEEAMLVRELRRDRLPGKIVRKTTEIDAVRERQNGLDLDERGREEKEEGRGGGQHRGYPG